MPSIPVLCLPPSRVDSKVLGLNVLVYHSQPGGSWTTGGLRQSGGGRSVAAMTWWWSSSGADRARCQVSVIQWIVICWRQVSGRRWRMKQKGNVMERRVRLKCVNPHIICCLCKGYMINATTITECLHTCTSISITTQLCVVSYAAFHWARKLIFMSFPVGNIIPLKSEVVFPSGKLLILRAPRLPTRKYELGNYEFPSLVERSISEGWDGLSQPGWQSGRVAKWVITDNSKKLG